MRGNATSGPQIPLDTGNCPGRDFLFAFLVGNLPPDAQETIADHVENCPRCLGQLRALDDSADPVIEVLRLPVPAGLFSEGACQRVLGRIEAIGLAPSGLGRAGEPSISPAPERWGDYHVLAPLGHGGMGAVYKARHVRLDKVVAVKVLAPHRLGDPKALARFRREMQAVGSLDHPNLIRALDAREEGGELLLVMEYLDGSDLAKVLHQHGPLSVANACEAVRQAAVGLQHAHARCQLVHRDIKPSNLLVTADGCVKVLDLGLARLNPPQRDEEERATGVLTTGNEMLGTVDYMAPEQWLASHTVDCRADVYSLGCTLYHLLAGRPPFAGSAYDSAGKKMLGHARDPAPSIRVYRPDVPEALAAVLERMLAKEPAERFAGPGAVAAALQPFLAGHDLLGLPPRGEQGGARTPSPTPSGSAPEAATGAENGNRHARPDRSRLVKRLAVGIAAAAVIVAISLVSFKMTERGSGRDPADPDSVAVAETPQATLRIAHFRLVRAEGEFYDLGELGDPASPYTPFRKDDEVVVKATFSAPVYPYLLVIDPDSTCEELFPKGASPQKMKQFMHPMGEHYLRLDQVGLVSFVVLAAQEPLPPFEQWKPVFDIQAWQKTKAAVPWYYDGQRFDPLARERVEKVSHVPQPFADVCRQLQQRPGVTVVRAIAIPVLPNREPPGKGKP